MTEQQHSSPAISRAEETSIDLSRFVRAGDRILWGQGAAEPRALTSALVEQRARLGGVEVFLGVSFSETLQPEHADHIRFRALGGFGSNARLSRAGILEVVPCHMSAVPQLIETGHIGVDVVFLQVSPADTHGRHSLGVAADYLWPAIHKARVVLAEVNEQTPRTCGDTAIETSTFAGVVHATGGPAEVVPASINPVENAIAELVAERIGDRSVLQFGIGAVPDAIATKLHGTRDLSIHTALLGDRVLELIQSGAVTNRYKPIDPGVTIAGLLVGTRRLYDFAHENPSLQMKSASYTHNPTVLAMLPKFVAINSAVEVDLTGQVNAEVVDGVHVGAVGGAVDFMRGAAAVHDGCAIVALPSTARGGTVSRIVARPTAGVTTAARSDVDLVVTEFGVAELKGRSISERALRLAAIAHEAFRDELLSAASTLA